MTRLRPVSAAGLVLLVLSPLVSPQAREEKEGVLNLPLTLREWNRALKEAGRRLAPSLLRLHVWETPHGPSFCATGVVVRPGIVVTLREAVEGKDLILGEPWKGEGYSLFLEYLGSSGPVAVLGYSFPAPPGLLRPVPPGKTGDLPGTTLVLLARGGEPGKELPVFLLPLLRRDRPSSPGKAAGRERRPAGEPLFQLEGFFPLPEARGALVCDTSLRMVGLLAFPLDSGVFPFRGPGRGKTPLGRVIPVERVLAAVEKVLEKGRGPHPPSPKGFTLGVIVLPNLVLDYVILGSPAQKAGLRKGDRITQFDGVPVKNLSAFQKVFLRSKGRKKEIFLQVERKGRKRLVKVRFP